MRTIALLGALCVWLLGCQQESPTSLSVSSRSGTEADSIAFTQVVDLIAGSHLYRNVSVIGALNTSIVLDDDSSPGEGVGLTSFTVFIHTEMQFKRSEDFDKAQSWTAGGKTGDVIVLGEGSAVLLVKSYQVWSIPNTAFINISYLVSPSSVDVRDIWVTYEKPAALISSQ